jgi:hypothetical protein
MLSINEFSNRRYFFISGKRIPLNSHYCNCFSVQYFFLKVEFIFPGDSCSAIENYHPALIAAMRSSGLKLSL